MSKIAMMAKIPAAAGKRDDLASVLATLVQATDDEAGTRLYILHEDVTDSDLLWMYELYDDQAALDAHSSSEAMKQLMGSLGDLAGGRPELIMLNPVTGKGL